MTPDDPRQALRLRLAALDERQRKVVGGLLAVMIDSPDKVRDREWMSEQFTQVLLLSAEDEVERFGSTREAVAWVQDYAREHATELLGASLQVFGFAAEDLAPRVSEGLSRQEALVHALGYLMEAPGG